jgi:hypothetical protein
MRPDNPAAQPCTNIDTGRVHNWIRRADGTASCINCGTPLTVEETSDAFPPSQVNKTAGGVAVEPRARKKKLAG